MLVWAVMRMICSSRFLNRLSCSTFFMATCTHSNPWSADKDSGAGSAPPVLLVRRLRLQNGMGRHGLQHKFEAELRHQLCESGRALRLLCLAVEGCRAPRNPPSHKGSWFKFQGTLLNTPASASDHSSSNPDTTAAQPV